MESQAGQVRRKLRRRRRRVREMNGGGGMSLCLAAGKLVEEGIMEEILLRLPVKSLIRFKCVCKSWRSLISHPCFARAHLSRGNPNSQRLLLALGKSSVLKFKTNSEEEEEVAANDLLVKFKLPKPTRMCKFVGSCHGLVCLDISDGTYTNQTLVVWNPTTGVFKEIPLPPTPTIWRWCTYDFDVLGFGYDPASDDYKILAYILDEQEGEETYQTNVVVFAMKENYWRSVCVRHLKFIPSRSGVYLNGFFHWLEWSDESSVSFVESESSCSILSFDFSNDKFERAIIPLPADMVTRGFIELAIFRGCLFIYTEYYQYRCFKCWIMEEHGSWTKLCDFTCQSRDGETTTRRAARVVCTTTTVGKVLLHILGPENSLCFYSPQDNSFQFAPFGNSVLHDAQLYVESLVSP